MPDITKCNGESLNGMCPKRDKCYRFTSIPSDWQSWFNAPFFSLKNKDCICEDFMEIPENDKNKTNNS